MILGFAFVQKDSSTSRVMLSDSVVLSDSGIYIWVCRQGMPRGSLLLVLVCTFSLDQDIANSQQNWSWLMAV